MNKNALFTLTYGLYLVGIEHNGKLNGCIVNTVMQVTDEVPRITVVLEKNHLTTKFIQDKKNFTISVLDTNTSDDLIANFGFISGLQKDKFENFPYAMDENNNPYLRECISHFSLDAENEIDVDTHIIFVCTIKDCEITSENKPLTYSEYHSRKKVAKINETASGAKKGYRCTVCNYVYEGEVLPDGYICPVCHQPSSAFVAID